MSRMIEQLLDFARARVGGGIPLSRREMDLVEICRKIVAETQLSVPGRPVDLTCSGELRGWWDEERLSQVVSNLVVNALRHGSADGAVKVVGERLADGRARLSVTNRGEIPAETLPGIFDPFRSGRRYTHGSDGLGLGLYIVQQIVRAHGGEITVSSSAAEGTRFSVTLPVGQALSPTPLPGTHRAAGCASAPR